MISQTQTLKITGNVSLSANAIRFCVISVCIAWPIKSVADLILKSYSFDFPENFQSIKPVPRIQAVHLLIAGLIRMVLYFLHAHFTIMHTYYNVFHSVYNTMHTTYTCIYIQRLRLRLEQYGRSQEKIF